MQGAGSLDVSTGLSSDKSMPAIVGEVPREPTQQVAQHARDGSTQQVPAEASLPELLICDVFSRSAFTAKPDSEITKV